MINRTATYRRTVGRTARGACLLLTLAVAMLPLAGRANEQSQAIQEALVEQSRQLIATARDLSGDARAKQLDSARALLQQVERQLAANLKETDAALQKIGVVLQKDPAKSAARERLHARQVQIRLAQATLKYELAKSFPIGSKERDTALTQAIEQFDVLIEQRGEVLAGLYAKLGRGRCLRERGNIGQAFAEFEELVAQPDRPSEFHTLRSCAAREAMETALSPALKKFKPALDIAHAWIAASTAVSQPDATDLAIRFLGGEAAMAYVETGTEAFTEQKQRALQELQWAREQFAMVSRFAGPYQDRARGHLLDPALGGESAKEPGTFVEARDYARAALDRMATAEMAVRDADPAAKAQRQQRMEKARDEAMRFCHAALRMHNSETPIDDVAAVRYYLAFAEFKAGQFDQAVILSEELSATNNSITAREAAKLALACYDALYRAAKTDDARAAFLSKMQTLADSVVTRWGNQAEVDDAQLVLLDAAVSNGDLAGGKKFLDHIPIDSSLRGEAELTYALGLGSQYRKLVDHRNAESELPLRAKAVQELLRRGIEHARRSVEERRDLSQTVAASVLTLCEIDLDLGQLDDALFWLEDAKLGLMPLMIGQHEAVQQYRFTTRAWTVALRLNVELERLAQAAVALLNLEASIGRQSGRTGQSAAAQQLTQTAISIGFDVERQTRFAIAGQHPDQAKHVADCWIDFLTSNVVHTAAEHFFPQAVAAEVHRGLAAALDPGGLRLPAEAERHYRSALVAYKTLLAQSESHAGYAPAPEAVVAFRIRAACCSRRLGDYRQSLSLILPVVSRNPNLVDAQVEAAYTYQSWGDDNPEYLALAMDGGQRYREIWGWRALALQVESRTGFQEIFFEARYNLAKCRLRQAQLASDQANRKRLLNSAASEIVSIERLHPDMGGKVWYDKYNELLRRIQRLANDPPIGLPPAPQN